MTDHKRCMQAAIDVSKFSEDPRTKVGCVLIDSLGVFISQGYNRMPFSLPANPEDWLPENKYHLVIHAEMSALFNSEEDLGGGICYTTLYPCIECAKALADAGISTVVYKDTKGPDPKVETLFERCGINVVRIEE